VTSTTSPAEPTERDKPGAEEKQRRGLGGPNRKRFCHPDDGHCAAY